MPKSLLIAVSSIVLISCALVCVGFLLPTSYSVLATTEINASEEALYALVNELEAWQRWYPQGNPADKDLKNRYEGPKSGVGAKWHWRRAGRSGSLEILKSDPLVGLELRMSAPRSQPSITEIKWSRGAGGKLEVRWMLSGELGQNPLARYFASTMEESMQKQFNQGLSKLKELAEGT